MKTLTESRAAAVLALMTLTSDAMAQGGGSPRRVVYMLVGGVIGGIIGFLLGLWWCRHCHEKNRNDKGDKPNDRQ
jgi:hypothetical protein